MPTEWSEGGYSGEARGKETMNTQLMTSNTLTTRQKLTKERQHLSRALMKSGSVAELLAGLRCCWPVNLRVGESAKQTETSQIFSSMFHVSKQTSF